MTSQKESNQSVEPPQGSGWPRSAKLTVGVTTIVAIVAIIFAVVAGQDDQASTVSGDDSAASVSSDDPSATVIDEAADSAGAEPADTNEVHQFGDTAELRGGGTTVDFTAETYFKSLKPDPYGYVKPSQKLVGFTLAYKNTGQKIYNSLADSDVVLIDEDSGQWETDDEEPATGSACTPTLFEIKLLPDSEARGCLTFTLPNNVTPSKLQVQLGGGYSPDIGIWEVPND